MGYPVFASGDVLNASDMNAVGLWKVTSTSFTGSSTVNVNDCFSSDYSNYVIFAAIRGSTATFARWRLRVAGADAAGANYFRAGFTTAWNAAGLTAYNGGLETSWLPFCEYGTTANGFGYSQISIFQPFVAATTGANVVVNNTDAASIYNQALTHGLQTSYTGFSVLPNAGTITGTITVYGVKP